MVKIEIGNFTEEQSVTLLNELLVLLPFDKVRDCICEAFETEYLRELAMSCEEKAGELDSEAECEDDE
jgi:hypothetical protein